MKYIIASLTLIIGCIAALLFSEKFGVKEILLLPNGVISIEKSEDPNTSHHTENERIEINVLEFYNYGEIIETYQKELCNGKQPLLMVMENNNKFLIQPTLQSCEPIPYCGRGKRKITIGDFYIYNSVNSEDYELNTDNLEKVFKEQYEDDLTSLSSRNTPLSSVVEVHLHESTKAKTVNRILLNSLRAHFKTNKDLNSNHRYSLELNPFIILIPPPQPQLQP
ncbi:MAG: hypothetical protein ACSHWW_05265 [Nonlabens sp.]|uniref:hypothetical protein n=1 Tax=Nonlabens sp. TaxID=1888209 RepID=UPI003EF2250E